MERIKFGKCQYHKTCKLYEEEGYVCNDGGFYGSNFAGCHKEMSEKHNSTFRLRDLIKKLKWKK